MSRIMRILIDMDGTIADWCAGLEHALVSQGLTTHFLDWSRWEGVRDDAHDTHRRMFAHAMASERFYLHLRPLPGAVDALHAMHAAGHSVRLCSTPDPTNATCADDKTEWVRRHLGPDWVRRMILTHDKTLVHGDVLIDDKPAITGEIPPFWEHVLYTQPYNTNIAGMRRITDWAEWAEVLA